MILRGGYTGAVLQRQCFVIYLSCQGSFVYNRGEAAKWDAQRAEDNSALRKEWPLCRIILRIKGRQIFCAAPARDCGKLYSARAGSLSCTRTVSCWNFWGWTLRRHRRSATRYGITESRMNTKELCRRPCPRRLPVPGQRCRRSSINGTIPFGGPYPCGAAA